ncbi:hypothetical protein ACFFWC_12155 [Plantactinospora siamensis]|uniref:Glyoxalase-like domain-containing protein n=1 Tax=Plantactinospora siamensis TaxID=555372 RepID=A0ABV6P1K6_9ACTN
MTDRYVIHLPVVVRDVEAARRLARVVARWTAILPQTDPGETTVSAEDDQGVRHRVFCDARLPGGRRCVLPADHDGNCARRLRPTTGRPAS